MYLLCTYLNRQLMANVRWCVIVSTIDATLWHDKNIGPGEHIKWVPKKKHVGNTN